MLALTGLPWEPVFVDFFKGETRGERYRSEVNELGEAPVLETDGKRISQSGVILDLLARETGKFAPGDEDERAECWRWILFDNHKFTGYLSVYRFLRTFMKDTDPAVLAFLKARAERAFAIADKHFTNHAFLLGDRPTIADISMAGYVFFPVEETGFDFKASLSGDRCLARAHQGACGMEASLRFDAGPPFAGMTGRQRKGAR